MLSVSRIRGYMIQAANLLLTVIFFLVAVMIAPESFTEVIENVTVIQIIGVCLAFHLTLFVTRPLAVLIITLGVLRKKVRKKIE